MKTGINQFVLIALLLLCGGSIAVGSAALPLMPCCNPATKTVHKCCENSEADSRSDPADSKDSGEPEGCSTCKIGGCCRMPLLAGSQFWPTIQRQIVRVGASCRQLTERLDSHSIFHPPRC